MSYLDMSSGQVVANAPATERQAFIKRTYLHLAGAIGVFSVVEALLQMSGIADSFVHLLKDSKWVWFIVLALFMGVSYIADKWARSAMSREMQYLGLGVFIVAEAIVFMPLIYFAQKASPGGELLSHAAILTALMVAGLTYTAFSTKKNFSFLGKYLMYGSFIALGIILAGMIFGFTLGLLFSAFMIIFASVAVLYSTSNIIHEYHTEQHVAASLSLFSSVALLFYYILMFLMALGDD